MAASAWDVFVIEAGFVLKVIGYLAVFGAGAYIGWKAKEMLGIFPVSTPGSNPYPSGVTVSPAETGGMIIRVDDSGRMTYVVPS